MKLTLLVLLCKAFIAGFHVPLKLHLFFTVSNPIMVSSLDPALNTYSTYFVCKVEIIMVNIYMYLHNHFEAGCTSS